ncbi:hypothetical protein RAS1_15760 [Phycisphaerae bacterium RAS1]|nr:hypothetical protein RAS1_15760 [Phycisphaerae bacterium RAS1]
MDCSVSILQSCFGGNGAVLDIADPSGGGNAYVGYSAWATETPFPTTLPQEENNYPGAPVGFVDPDGADNLPGTIDDDLRLLLTSPIIDAGPTFPAYTFVDLDGHRRVHDGNGDGSYVVDLGAYEFGSPPYTPILYVKPPTSLTEPTSGDGASWTSAFRGALGLQTALTYAAGPANAITEVWVAGGTYRPSRPLPPQSDGSRSASFQLASDVALYGGFNGTETQRSQRSPTANVTILNGDLNGNEPPTSNYDDNSHHVVKALYVNASAIMDGFTIRAGNAIGDVSPNGGGLFILESGGPLVENCTFVGNRGVFGGAAYTAYATGATFRSCRFEANTANHGGACMTEFGSIVRFDRCQYLNNTASGSGGAALVDRFGTVASFSLCEFLDNHADVDAGALLSADGGTAVLGQLQIPWKLDGQRGQRDRRLPGRRSDRHQLRDRGQPRE